MANFGLRDMPVERDTALKACMNALINIEMHHKMIVAVTSLDQRRSAPWRRVFLRLDASYLANRLQALLGVEQTIRMENFSYLVRCRWGLPFLMKMVIPDFAYRTRKQN